MKVLVVAAAKSVRLRSPTTLNPDRTSHSQGKATWDPPGEYAWREIPSTDKEHEGRTYFENWVTKEARAPPPLTRSYRSLVKRRRGSFSHAHAAARPPLLQ